MIPKTFNILFFLKKPKNKPSFDFAIYLRITIEGEQKEWSVGRKCSPDKWNQKSGRAIGNKESIKHLNYYLDEVQSKAYEAKRILIERGTPLTSQNILDFILGKCEKPKMIVQLFEEHNQKVKELIGKTFSILTFKRYSTTKRILSDFIILKYGIPDMEVSKLDFEFISSFGHYLQTKKSCNPNTTKKHLVGLRKLVNECRRQRFVLNDPFFGFKLPSNEVKREVLTMEELKNISEKQFDILRLAQVRDIFLFCCYTGLSYIDIKNLNRQNISLGIDGEDWIFSKRQKTDTETRIPLLPKAKQLAEKYKVNPECIIKNTVLPVPTNQKMNAYLKEIGDICGINKPLTTHIARHTFATTMTLNNNVPIETVSKLLGHTNLRTTQLYAKILDLKVSADINNLKNILTLKT